MKIERCWTWLCLPVLLLTRRITLGKSPSCFTSVSLPPVAVSLFSWLPFVHGTQWASALCWELSLLDGVFAVFKALT